MQKPALIIVFILSILTALGQETIPVEVKGYGVKREDALQDALRAAVQQAAGVAVQSETRVENFMVLSDAISTRTEGYITNYQVVKETPFPDRYEILVKATVSLSPLKADLQTLARSVGGIRFLVMYDPFMVQPGEPERYDFAVERANEALSERKYRYIEKSRFESLKKESEGLFRDNKEQGPEKYVEYLGFKADAQFIIFISKVAVQSRSEAFDTRTASKVSIEIKAYDNCTAEGLGTVVLESGWITGRDEKSTLTAGITEAMKEQFPRLLAVFNTYIGEWVNNGTPFELRFYSAGSYRDFRDLRSKLKTDANFGGQMEIVGFDHYSKLNCTFRKKPDELADVVLDYADQVPFFKDKQMDVRLIYGRQISFAPRNAVVPELDANKAPANSSSTEAPPKTNPAPVDTKSKTTPPPASKPPVKKKTTPKKKG